MEPQKRRPGRPPTLSQNERRGRILEAAEKVFEDTGFGAASMEQIARAAGMSKKTLYQIYPDKEAVFTALVSGYGPWPPHGMAVGADIQAGLRAALMDMALFVLSPRQVAMTRLIVSEARHSPELAKRFYENCLQRCRSSLVDRLQAVLGPRDLGGCDPGTVADCLFGGAIYTLHLRILVGGLDSATVREELETTIAAALIGFSGLTGGS